MNEIFLRESLIFSKQWNQEDILKLLKFEEDTKGRDISDEYEDDNENDDKKIKLEEYSDLLDKFTSLFKQEEINNLKNNFQILIEYFYLRELMIEEYISDKFKLNDNKRHLNSRLTDYLLRINFEENEAIKEDAKLINQFISEINESYFKKDNLEDLSDQTYMSKIEIVLGTKKIPNFLLREGFRIRREIKKNKEIFINNAISENELEDKSTIFSESDNGNFSDNEDNIIINNEIYDINDIIREIEKEGKLPFVRTLNEVYIILFFLAMKEIKKDDLYEDIKNNINIFIDCFRVETYKTYEDFKQNYIDIDTDKISTEIISTEFSEINKSEYTCKYILASFKVLINKLFNDPSFVYINLLQFLLKYISEENKLLKSVIKNELNSFLLLIDEQNQKDNDENIEKSTIILDKYNYDYHFNIKLEPKSDNFQQYNYQNPKENYNNNYLQNNNQYQFNNYNNNYQINNNQYQFNQYQFNNNFEQNPEYQYNIYQNPYKNNLHQNYIYQPKKYHTTKYMDFYSINNIMQKDYKLCNRFNEVVKEEELYEEGSYSLKYSILSFFKRLFRIKESENTDTIKKHLKLVPYTKGKFEEKTILILISGYFSSEDDQFKEWNNLIKVYKKRFNSPIIYFYNWPSSKVSFKKLIFHRKDFRDARERGKYCGRLLALMIMSDIFNGFKINLSAFSLGNHVLKHCLKELENFNRLDLINNVVFMAGATDIKCNLKWERRLRMVTGTIVNCYSDQDLALWYCRNITHKDTIGSKKLKFDYVEVINRLISSFHIFYRKNMDKLWNMFINVLKV